MRVLNIDKIREEFSFLRKENIDKVGKKIIYFDSAATSQKPDIVINAISDYYKYSNANAGRSAHFLGFKADKLIKEARKTVANFINSSEEEVIFTRSATDGINLVASVLGKEDLNEGDEIITTIIEHHANFVPWQELAKEKKLKLNIVDIDDNCNLKVDEIFKYLNKNTKILAITAASNVTAEIINLKEIIKKIRKFNKEIIVVVDATQYISCKKVDVKEFDCDFLVFSGHKIYAPMGIGILYGKKEILEKVSPYQYGGSMIEYVYKDKSSYRDIPNKFEAGTLNVEGITGLKIAIDWLENIGIENIKKYEDELVEYTLQKMKNIENIQIFRTTNKDSTALISFNFKDIHPHDISSILDSFGIATRAGHHCAMPLHTRLNIPATSRISFAIFNTKKEVDFFIEKLLEVRKIMGK